MYDTVIPAHLVQERTIPSKCPMNFNPPFPAYVARFPSTSNGLVMGIFGVQHHHKTAEQRLANATPPSSSPTSDDPDVKHLASFVTCPAVAAPNRPRHHDTASCVDALGARNTAIIAYWPDATAFAAWGQESGFDAWWASLETSSVTPPPSPHRHHHHHATATANTAGTDAVGEQEGRQNRPVGYFLEVLTPSADRFETVFSCDEADAVDEGAAHLRCGVSGPVREHVYWGSMRDRLPVAQGDALCGEDRNMEGGKDVEEEKNDVVGSGDGIVTTMRKVKPRKNLAVIRSGQDWSHTTPEERQLYLETMHPVLIEGMEFLRDKGRGDNVGCWDCRFMEVLPADKTEKTFGLAYFEDLGSLERWSKEHQTHRNIFGGFLKYARTLENNVSLRLFHEVMVLEPHQQRFEYFGCHERTGMLGSIAFGQ